MSASRGGWQLYSFSPPSTASIWQTSEGPKSEPPLWLGGRFGYFLFFSVRGGGRGSSRRQEGGGDRFLLKIPGGEGCPRGERAEGLGGCLRRIGEFWGGGRGG